MKQQEKINCKDISIDKFIETCYSLNSKKDFKWDLYHNRNLNYQLNM